MKDSFNEREGGGGKICPFCGSNIAKEAVKCKECHLWLNTKNAERREQEIKEAKTESSGEEKKKSEYVNCPYCAEEIPAFAYICKHCRENIHNRKARRLAFKLHETDKLDIYYKPVWILVLLSMMSMNLYQFFWFYKNWRFIKVHMKLKVRLFLKLIYLFIPLIGEISIYHQFKSINLLAERNEVSKTFSPLMVLFVWCIFQLEGIIFLLATLFGGMSNYLLISITLFMGLLSVFPLTLVQDTMNAILVDEKPNMKISNKVHVNELFTLLVFISIWIIAVWFFIFKK